MCRSMQSMCSFMYISHKILHLNFNLENWAGARNPFVISIVWTRNFSFLWEIPQATAAVKVRMQSMEWKPIGTNCLGCPVRLSTSICMRFSHVACKTIWTKQFGHQFEMKKVHAAHICAYDGHRMLAALKCIRPQENHFDCTKIRSTCTNYRMQVCSFALLLALTHKRAGIYCGVCMLSADYVINQIWVDFCVYITRKKASQFNA